MILRDIFLTKFSNSIKDGYGSQILIILTPYLNIVRVSTVITRQMIEIGIPM